MRRYTQEVYIVCLSFVQAVCILCVGTHERCISRASVRTRGVYRMHKYVQSDYLVRKYVHAEYILRRSSHNTKLFKRYGIPFAQVECIQLQRPAILQNILHCTTANQAGKSHARPTNAHHLRPFRSTVRWLKRMHLRWSWCTLYLLVCHVRATVGDSGLCC